MEATGELGTILAFALRSLRQPQAGLAAVLAGCASHLQASVVALYTVSDGSELLASAGSHATVLGPPDVVEPGFASALLQWGRDARPHARPAAGLPEPWRDQRSVTSLVGHLPGDEAVLLLVGSPQQPEDADVELAMSAALVLANAHLSARREEEYRIEMRRSRQESALLAAGLQHDLRTPLTSILGCARTLRQRSDAVSPEQRGELLDIIADQATRLNEMVGGALLRHADRPDVPVRMGPVNPMVVAERVARAACSARRGEIAIDVAEVPIVTDEHRLERALLNLVDNALTYSPHDRAVQIVGSEAGSYFTLTVADAGPGVAPEVAHSLFTPYAHDPHRDGSTGLGLHSVSEIAAELGGCVTHTRQAGWTRFTISLPLGEPDAPSVPRPAEVEA